MKTEIRLCLAQRAGINLKNLIKISKWKTQENFAKTLNERGFENVYIPSKCETLVLE